MLRSPLTFLLLSLISLVSLVSLVSISSFAEPAGSAITLRESIDFDLRLVSTSETPLKRASWDGSTTYYLQAEVILKADQIAQVTRGEDASKKPVLNITLTPKGAQAFAEATGKHVNAKLAISVAGKVVSAPVIREKISGGRLQVSLETNAKEILKAFSKE